MNWRLIGCLAFSLASCKSPVQSLQVEATQIVVVVDVDPRLDSKIDDIQALISWGSSSSEKTEVFALKNRNCDARTDAYCIPFSFGIGPGGEDISQPVTIKIDGRKIGESWPIVGARAITHFIKNKSLILPVYLHLGCSIDYWDPERCSSLETCVVQAGVPICVSAEIDSNMLEDHSSNDGDELYLNDGGPPDLDVGPRVVNDAGTENDTGIDKVDGGTAPPPRRQFFRGFGGVEDDALSDLATDSNANAYIVGSFTGVLNIDGQTHTSSGADDIFLATYTSTGALRWAHTFGGILSDEGSAVAVDGAGNVYLAGAFDDAIEFGGPRLSSNGGTDIFVAKFTSNGQHEWSYRYGSVLDDYVTEMAITDSGDLFVVGTYLGGTAEFGGVQLVNNGDYDCFVASYRADGTHRWSQNYGGTGNDECLGLALDPDEKNMYLTGNFEDTINFGQAAITSTGSIDIFLVKLNENGAPLWANSYGTSQAESATAVAVDTAGNVYLTGYFSTEIDLGGNSAAKLSSNGLNDVFLAKYDRNGDHQESQSIGGAEEDQGLHVFVGRGDNIYLTGFFSGRVWFGQDDTGTTGETDVFVQRYFPGGGFVRFEHFGGRRSDKGVRIVAPGNGSVYVAGTYEDTITQPSGTGLVSSGGKDIFLISYAQAVE